MAAEVYVDETILRPRGVTSSRTSGRIRGDGHRRLRRDDEREFHHCVEKDRLCSAIKTEDEIGKQNETETEIGTETGTETETTG